MLLHDKRAVSRLSAIALSAVVAIIVVFGAYIGLNNASPGGVPTTTLGTTRLGVVTTFITTCEVCTTTSYSPPGITTGSNSENSSVTNSSFVGKTFNYATMPKFFRIGSYNFAMIYNGTYYTSSANGSEYANLGFNTVLNVTSLQTGRSQTVDFGWAPPVPQPYSLPTPANASLFGGLVLMHWYSNTTGISGIFLTIWIVGNVSATTTSNTLQPYTTTSCSPSPCSFSSSSGSYTTYNITLVTTTVATETTSVWSNSSTT